MPRGKQLNPSLQKHGTPKTTVAVIWMSCKALSNVRGPTNAARIRRNSGAKLIQPPLSPVRAQFAALTVRAGLLGMFAPDEVPHISSRCTWVTGRSRHRWVLISCAFWAARRSHARTVASVTPRTKPMSDRATVTRSIFSAMSTCSSGVLRSKKTVSGVSEKGFSQAPHRKIRRFPLWVR